MKPKLVFTPQQTTKEQRALQPWFSFRQNHLTDTVLWMQYLLQPKLQVWAQNNSCAIVTLQSSKETATTHLRVAVDWADVNSEQVVICLA